MTFDEFAEANKRRCESPTGFNHKIESWSLSDWITATLGELGEAANIVKKLNRIRDSVVVGPAFRQIPVETLRKQLADEIADTFIYLDLLAQRANFDLEKIVIDKFNEKSLEIGYLELLAKKETEK